MPRDEAARWGQIGIRALFELQKREITAKTSYNASSSWSQTCGARACSRMWNIEVRIVGRRAAGLGQDDGRCAVIDAEVNAGRIEFFCAEPFQMLAIVGACRVARGALFLQRVRQGHAAEIFRDRSRETAYCALRLACARSRSSPIGRGRPIPGTLRRASSQGLPRHPRTCCHLRGVPAVGVNRCAASPTTKTRREPYRSATSVNPAVHSAMSRISNGKLRPAVISINFAQMRPTCRFRAAVEYEGQTGPSESIAICAPNFFLLIAQYCQDRRCGRRNRTSAT